MSRYPKIAKKEIFLQQMRTIVKQHLSDPNYTIPQLCVDIGMSHPQLHRKLTALTGLSALRFVRSIRLAQAKILLRTTQKTVSEIAYDTGFADPAYFARIFKRETGMPPTTYRNSRPITHL